MSIRTKVKGWLRSVLADDFFFAPFFPGRNTYSGASVTPDTALTYTAVYSAVKIISETMASLPLITYRRLSDGGKERVPTHPVAELLFRKPNRWQTPFEWKEMMQGHVLLRGNAYSQIVFTNGRPSELIPLHPSRVTPEMGDDGVVYKYREPGGDTILFRQEQIFHLRNITLDGVVGISPIAAAREAIGLGMSAQEHGARLFGQGARPAGVLTHPGKLDKIGADRVKQSWQSAYGGLTQAHSVAVLEEGMNFQQIEMTSEDSQWIESRKFQLEEISRYYRIPLSKLNVMENANFSNMEQQALQFVQDCIMPWSVRWEEAVLRDLLMLPTDRDLYSEFQMQSLLRGDNETRFKAYAIARQNGWMSANEIRAAENLNPMGEEGDVYWAPVNMTNAEVLTDAERIMENQDSDNDQGSTPAGSSNEGLEDIIDTDPRALPPAQPKLEWHRASEFVTETYQPVLFDALRRCVRKEALTISKVIKRDKPVKYIEEFYRNHADHVNRELRSGVEGYVRSLGWLKMEGDAPDSDECERICLRALDQFTSKQIEISQDVLRLQLAKSRPDEILSDVNFITSEWEADEVIRANVDSLLSTARSLTLKEKTND